MEDIAQIFALEVKQELASRYFGFRKQIEIDTQNYLDRLGSTGKEYIKLITTDLLTIRHLLGTNDLFDAFLDMLGYPKVLVARLIRDYGDPNSITQLLKEAKAHGLTKRRRLRNTFFNIYRGLVVHISHQHEMFMDLHEEYSDICTKIQKFYRQNDISSILDFLRQIDSHPNATLNAQPGHSLLEQQKRLEDDLRISPPPPVESSIEALTPPPPLEKIKKKLTTLLDKIPDPQIS